MHVATLARIDREDCRHLDKQFIHNTTWGPTTTMHYYTGHVFIVQLLSAIRYPALHSTVFSTENTVRT